MFFGPWLAPPSDDELPPSPYLEKRGLAQVPPQVVTSIGAYEAIRETLLRESLEGVAEQSGVIARAFAGEDQRIVSLAKRLAAEQDVESARRAFRRLHRLMQRHADKLPKTS
jgi:hypothetical protein